MTACDLKTPTLAGNWEEANQTTGHIFDLGRIIQSKARQVEQLVATCEETLGTLFDGAPVDKERLLAAGERMSVFLDLAHRAAEEIEDTGEKIEAVEADFVKAAGSAWNMGSNQQSASDAAIKAAWARRLTALEAFNSLAEPATRACWVEIGAADEEIRQATATTIQGARIQLHCAMLRMVGKQAEETALLAGDLATFEEVADLDYPEQLAFAALRSLSAMEVRHDRQADFATAAGRH